MATRWNDDVSVTVTLSRVRGRIECVRLDVRPNTGALQATDMRLPWGEVVQEAKERLLESVASIARMTPAEDADDDDTGGSLARPSQAEVEAARAFQEDIAYDEAIARGDLLAAAVVYDRALKAGLNPQEQVATTFRISRSAAGKRIQRARDKGWLKRAPGPKQPGGGLTKKAMDRLKEAGLTTDDVVRDNERQGQ